MNVIHSAAEKLSNPPRHTRPRSSIQVSVSECFQYLQAKKYKEVRGIWILNRVEDDEYGYGKDGKANERHT